MEKWTTRKSIEETSYRRLLAVASIAFAVLAIAGVVSMSDGSDAYENECGNGVVWSVDGSTLNISFVGDPSVDDGEMWDMHDNPTPWFDFLPNVDQIVVGEGVTSLGHNAFNDTGAEYVVLPKSLEKVGEGAFYNCALYEIVLPEGMALTDVGDSAFHGCANLLKIELPDTVERIGYMAFMGCSSLEEFKIPACLEDLGRRAFSKCSSMEGFVVPAENTRFSVDSDGVLYNGDKTVLISFPAKKAGFSYSVQDGVKKIADGAFDYTYDIREVKISDSVETIGGYAFFGCDNLTRVFLGKNVSEIGDNAFYSCSTLYEVCNNSSLEITPGSEEYGKIGVLAINVYSDGKGSSIIHPYSQDGYDYYFIKDLDGRYLLTDSDVVGEMVLPETPMYFDEAVSEYRVAPYAFVNENAITSLVVPSSVNAIGDFAFASNNLLESVVFEGGIDIGSCAFHSDKKIRSVEFSDERTVIGHQAFINCVALTDLRLGKDIPSIGQEAFRYCNVEKVEIPDSVTEMGDSVFSNCLNLREAKIGSGLDRIPDYTFDLCVSLGEIVIPENIKGIGDEAFYRDAFLTGVTFEGDVEYIGDKAFYDCESLESVEIPESVTHIGVEAFTLCKSLRDVSWPSDLTEVNDGMFNTCESLSRFDFSNITRIGNNAFTGTALSEALLRDDVEEIGESAFGLTKIRTFEVPPKIDTIKTGAFAYCEDLEYVKINEGVVELEDGAFYSCTSLKAVSLPDSVSRLNDEAFACCDSLDIIEFGDSLDFFGAEVFHYDFYDEAGNKYLRPETMAGKAFRLVGDRYVECDVGHVTVNYSSEGKSVSPSLYVPVEVGSEYSFDVPEIDGRSASIASIDGVMSEDVVYDVEYSSEKGKSSGSNDLYNAILVFIVAAVAIGALVWHSRK